MATGVRLLVAQRILLMDMVTYSLKYAILKRLSQGESAIIQIRQMRKDVHLKILFLCANHHIETNNVELWPVRKLWKLKEDHEKQFLNKQFPVTDQTIQKIILTDYLESIAVDLDRGCLNLALTGLKRIKSTIEAVCDDHILLEFGLLEAKTLRSLNKSSDAKLEYESLVKIYPSDPRPLLYWAELEIDLNGYEKNLELLQKAESIAPDHWLVKIEKLVRDLRLGNVIDTSAIDETTFPISKRERSTFYRLHAVCYEKNKDYGKADQFIEKAIQLNPDRLSNYIIRLSFQNDRLSGNRSMKLLRRKRWRF